MLNILKIAVAGTTVVLTVIAFILLGLLNRREQEITHLEEQIAFQRELFEVCHEIQKREAVYSIYKVSHKFLRVNTTSMFQHEVDTFNHRLVDSYQSKSDSIYRKVVDNKYEKTTSNHWD